MKILHLEDNRDDAGLVEAILREEWPECRVTLVVNLDDRVTFWNQGALRITATGSGRRPTERRRSPCWRHAARM